MKHLGFASVAAVQQYLRYAKAQNLDVADLLMNSGLPAGLATQDGGRITGTQFKSLLEEIERRSNDSLMGFNSAAFVMVQSYSILGVLVQHCQSIAEAIEHIPPFERLVGDMGTTSIEKSTHQWTLHWRCRYPAPKIKYHMIDNVFASWSLFARWLAQEPHSYPHEIYLERPQPKDDDLQKYQLFYHCPVHFGAAKNSLVLPEKLLRLPIKNDSSSADLSLLEGKARSAMSDLALDGESFAARVTRAVHAHLQLGQVDKALIAQEFNVSPRHLQRKLEREGTNYKTIIEKVREVRAYELKKTGTFSAEEMAHNLGYQDERSYYRSKKRWQQK